ncbi:hypothetical protein [Pontibacter oryzae]|uniref:Uncharacterized protein n=1 Tax=Pontibacter oryzae TaxID=2304593 RepID=A0A399SJ88_9BACT|nr:hypothetical protein [Pontibacter oryzae]RIJ41815.1 hypothetical protein D1627_07300 [Pontibacter oryzae]
MIKQLYSIAIIGVLCLSACSTPESLKSFDSKTWKDDRYACSGKRGDLVDDLEAIKKELYGKKEYVLRNVLGKPDSEELMERNQRIYYYYLEPGTQCENRNMLSDANRVQVRINSLGKVSEVSYYRPIKTTKPE